MYRHVKHLQAVDTDAAAGGRPSNLSGHYKEIAGLTAQQAEAMRIVSLAALAELDELDRQARELIVKARGQARQGLLPGQKPRRRRPSWVRCKA